MKATDGDIRANICAAVGGVGVAVGTSVDVGSGVSVGAAAGVGIGVGLAVGTGVAAGVGLGVAVGTDVGGGVGSGGDVAVGRGWVHDRLIPKTSSRTPTNRMCILTAVSSSYCRFAPVILSTSHQSTENIC